jgi:hypothetical protein
MANEDSAPSYWQNQLNNWTKTKGLENYLGSGLQDSTVGRSGFFDQATAQGQALREAGARQAQGIIGQAPVVGINPSSGAEQLQGASTQQAKRGVAGINAAVQGGQGQAQSTQDWINQMMGSQSQAINANNQNWQNYQQAMYQGAVNNAASQNAAQGAMWKQGGQLLGMAGGAAIGSLGGPMGTMVGAGLGSQLGGMA